MIKSQIEINKYSDQIIIILIYFNFVLVWLNSRFTNLFVISFCTYCKLTVKFIVEHCYDVVLFM